MKYLSKHVFVNRHKNWKVHTQIFVRAVKKVGLESRCISFICSHIAVTLLVWFLCVSHKGSEYRHEVDRKCGC